MTFVRGILDRIVLVAGIVAAGCVPSFIAQYRQRVGGRLDQVLQDIAPFQQIANQFHHGSLEELIQYHLASPDSTFHNEGAALLAMVNSAEQLRRALEALNTDLFHQLCLFAYQDGPGNCPRDLASIFALFQSDCGECGICPYRGGDGLAGLLRGMVCL